MHQIFTAINQPWSWDARMWQNAHRTRVRCGDVRGRHYLCVDATSRFFFFSSISRLALTRCKLEPICAKSGWFTSTQAKLPIQAEIQKKKKKVAKWRIGAVSSFFSFFFLFSFPIHLPPCSGFLKNNPSSSQATQNHRSGFFFSVSSLLFCSSFFSLLTFISRS